MFIDTDYGAALMFGHLVDEVAGHRSIWMLSDHVLNLSSHYLALGVFTSDCSYEVYLDVGVDIRADFFSHSFCHCFVSAGTVAEGVIVIWAIILVVVTNDRTSRRNKRNRRADSLMCDNVAFIFEDFRDF